MQQPKPCRTCGAPMVWVVTPRGKKMPLDAEPVSNGEWVLKASESDDEGTREYGNVHVEPAPADYRGERFTSHFKTCPQAQQHSRKR